jgi:hypothetical protein
VSKDYNYEVGYETLQTEWKVQYKRTPRGVSLVKGGNNIYLQFKTPNTPRSKYKCNCRFSIDGMHEAVRKAHKVAEKLKTLDSETKFWNWYKKEIEQESQLADDRITFGEAIAKVEDDFWNRPSRTKQPRDKDNPSDINSFRETYGKFYRHLPGENFLNLEDILEAINKQEKGTRTHGYSVGAMKKLAEINKKRDILDALGDLDTTQTKFLKLQSIDLDDFLKWRDKVLGITTVLDKRCNLDSRKAWIWVFSIQIVYALRINEVFAIKNLTEPYRTKDGVVIPALNDPKNTSNLIYIGKLTNLNTKVKTGDRLARPQIPPRYPDLMEKLEIKTPLVPQGRTKSSKPETLVKFHAKEARSRLVKWDAPFTQTHADRNLGNINGMQAGIPLEIRAMSLGHTPAQNDSNYKNRIGTKTKIDLLLNSNTQAIDFVTALGEAKKLVRENESDKEIISRLLSIIYQKNEKEISKLL